MVPLAVVNDKIVGLHEGLDLERGWLIHKSWGTVFLWWVALILALVFTVLLIIVNNSGQVCPGGVCLKLLYAPLISLFWFGVISQMYGTRLQIEQNQVNLKEAAELMNGCVDDYTYVDLSYSEDATQLLVLVDRWTTCLFIGGIGLVLSWVQIFWDLFVLCCCAFGGAEDEGSKQEREEQEKEKRAAEEKQKEIEMSEKA